MIGNANRRWMADQSATLHGEPRLGASIELDPSEAGKEWAVEYDYLLETTYGVNCIYAGFVHDGDSYVMNFEERDPALPKLIVPIDHDFSFVHRIHADGSAITFEQANNVYLRNNRASTNWKRRQVAEIRYAGVSSPLGWLTWHGWPPWGPCKQPKPIPAEKQYLYGASAEAVAARASLPLFCILDNRLCRIR